MREHNNWDFYIKLAFYQRQNPVYQRSTPDAVETKIFLFLTVKDGTIALSDRHFYLT